MKKLNKGNTSPQPKNSKETTVKKDTKMRKGKILNSIMICFLSLALIGGASAFFILIAVMQDAPDINSAMFNATNSTKILDKNGDVAMAVGAENRENITYEQLPQTVVDAFLSIEDSRYFTHNGFDLPRFVSSAINNLRSGSLGQGGSTLTMQMIDNTRKDDPEYDEANASSLTRIKWKIQEIMLSMKANQELSKEDILTKYLNKVNFGYTARGIQKGAQYYFGKDVSQLNLSESAFLAGVVNAPNMFNPYKGTQWSKSSEQWINYYDYAVDRRDTTLYQMWNHGYITEDEYKLAKSTELAFQLNGEKGFHADSSQSFLNMVAKEASEKYGINIYTESCVVYTSLDPKAQEEADDLSSADSITIKNGKNANIPNDDNYNFGTTMLNAKTGEIVAVSAGRDFNPDDKTAINQALETHNTGSAIKPILAYAPGFDQLGYSTSHTFSDVPMDIYGTGMVLSNADRKYRGDVSFADTVGNSWNTTAAQSLKDIIATWGESNVKDYMKSLGFPQKAIDEFSLQYAIGGAEMKLSTTQMAAAYAIFANGGKYIEPHTITKIEFPDDAEKETIEPKYEGVQTISPQAAYLMSDILHSATSINYFMQNAFPGVGYTVYGKTGTSDWGDIADRGNPQIPDGAIKDEWMVNYTSDYVVATWSGYEKADYVDDDVLYQNIPGHINRNMLDTISAEQAPSSVARPDGISTISHIKGKYPYTAPTEGIPSDMVVSGMIRSDKVKLQSLAADDLSELASFNATLDSAKNLTLDFASYPDINKTVDPSHQKGFTILGISFTGNVFYDPGFVFGKVVYKADIKVNGSVVQTITTSDPKSSQSLTVGDGQTIQVCGYYAYEHAGKTSSQKCVDVNVKSNKPSVDVSGLNAVIADANNYVDPTKFRQEDITALQTAVTNASAVLNKKDVTQDEINAQIAAVNAAITQCKNNPLTPPVTPPAT